MKEDWTTRKKHKSTYINVSLSSRGEKFAQSRLLSRSKETWLKRWESFKSWDHFGKTLRLKYLT